MKPFRFFVLLMGIMGAYALLATQLYILQIINGSLYSTIAASQYRLAGFLEPHRGRITITDKNNASIPVATNTPYTVVIAVPRDIKDIDRAVENISPLISVDEQTLRQTLGKKRNYQILLENPTPEQITAISEAAVPGIHIEEREKRVYPFNTLASHILGFVGANKNDESIAGRYGLEKQLNALLSGAPGSLSDNVIIKPVQGNDSATTIDRVIQSQAETIIKNLVEKHKATGGSIIVQEPATGKILAMANAPDFNPNEYSKAPLSALTNSSVQARYEPGSVFKIFTASIGLDTRAFTPETTYYDSGALKFSDGTIIKNWDLKAHGTMTMTQVIEKSLNTGAAFMESKIGHKPFYAYMRNFGFDEPTGIELPGEVSGNLKNIKTHTADIDFATASFGQGVAVTPLQLITAASAIANGGMLMKPYILQSNAPRAVRRVLSAEAARATTDMMVSAVRKAEVAQIPHYFIAGKTGTAQAVDFFRGGYTKEVINTYVGFAPTYSVNKADAAGMRASNPQFIILIKLDKPAGAPLAGVTVVPAFRELAEFIINYYAIPPDNLKTDSL